MRRYNNKKKDTVADSVVYEQTNLSEVFDILIFRAGQGGRKSDRVRGSWLNEGWVRKKKKTKSQFHRRKQAQTRNEAGTVEGEEDTIKNKTKRAKEGCEDERESIDELNTIRASI